jgi:hypothetical protein
MSIDVADDGTLTVNGEAVAVLGSAEREALTAALRDNRAETVAGLKRRIDAGLPPYFIGERVA